MTLVLKGIVKTFGSFTLRADFLEIPGGKVVCVKGPNGSGKSTLLNIIAGIVPPDSGKILYRGVDITDLEPEKRRFPIIRSEKGIFPHMSVERNIKIAKRVDDGELNRILELLKINHEDLEKKAGSLSTGWKIRVSLARGLASAPGVMLIDEGLDHLDPWYIECCLKNLMSYMREKGIITLVVTHRGDISCDETLVMINGLASLESKKNT
ncbi:MAG TPA: ATP-binding cassette domain-containing protein [Sulfolobales archaeon]|nr:ATP-binding cassette domain-containing protein [Sulfolobales archaeon]